jgi:hypothetical protein
LIRERIDIGHVVRNAHVFNFRKAAVNESDLLVAVDELFKLLEARKIAYVLVDGIALLHYIEGRNTEDIDLIVALPDLQKLPEIEILEQSEYRAQGQLGTLKIDFLLTRNRLFAYVQRNLTTVQDFAGRRVRCATVEGLLLLKLYALPSLYRQGNFARVGLYENDIATLMQTYRPDTAALLVTLESYLNATDMAAVEEISGEIQQRIERFERRL